MTCVWLKETSITCSNPTFRVFGRGCAFRIFVIFYKRAFRAIVDLAVFLDTYLNTFCRHAHGVSTHFTIWLDSDKNRGFCLAIQLLEVDTKRAIEVKNLGANGLTRRITNTHTAKAKRVLEWSVDTELTKLIL